MIISFCVCYSFELSVKCSNILEFLKVKVQHTASYSVTLIEGLKQELQMFFVCVFECSLSKFEAADVLHSKDTQLEAYGAK